MKDHPQKDSATNNAINHTKNVKKDTHQLLNITIEENAWLGRGVGHMPDGKVVFVPFAIKGEIIETRIKETKKDFCIGRFMKRVTSIPESITPPCPYFSECGGCDYQHLPYEKQLEVKDDIRTNTLVGKYKFDTTIIEPITPSKKQFGYRNKVRLETQDGQPSFTIKNTRKKIPVKNCLLLDPRGQEVLQKLNKEEYEKWHDLTIRVGDNGPQAIVEGGRKHGLGRRKIVINEDLNLSEKPLEITYTIKIDGKNDESKKNKTISKKFQFGENAFFQVNKEVSQNIFERVINAIPHDANVYDLYGGVGVIGILAAETAKKVIIVESSEESAVWGELNIKNNNCTNVTYESARVEEYIQENDLSGDTLIIDPPRAGISPEVIEAIKKSTATQICYISCDVQTFARDLDLLREDFNIEVIAAYDMFPNTYHIESLAIMTKK